jgi:hypothetical protein
LSRSRSGGTNKSTRKSSRSLARNARKKQTFLDDLSNSDAAVRLYREGRQPAQDVTGRSPLQENAEIMSQYLVAIHHPDDYDPSTEDEAMSRDIDVLNDEMVAAGVRVFVGGLSPASSEVAAGATRWQGSHHRRAVPGDQGAHRRLLGAGSRYSEDAIAWGRKAVVACRAPVEVRPFGRPTEADIRAAEKRRRRVPAPRGSRDAV